MRKVVVTALLVLCTLGLTVVSSHAQPLWTTNNSLVVPGPVEEVEGLYVGTYGDVIVAAFGETDAGDTNTTRIYTVGTNTWSIGPTAPEPVRAEGVAVVRSKYLYAIGGREFGVPIGNLDRYDFTGPGPGSWLPAGTLTAMPTARAGLTAAVVGSRIYAIGGRDSGGGPCTGTATAVVEKYTVGAGTSGTWSTCVAPLPSARSDLAAIAPGDGKIYVFGGCNGGPPVFDDVDVFDPNAGPLCPNPNDGRMGTWTALEPMTTPRASLVVGKIKNAIYAIGGMDDSFAPLATNESFLRPTFSPPLGSWTTELDMPTARGEAGNGTVPSRKDSLGRNAIFVIGGGLPAFGVETAVNESFTNP